MEIKLQGLTKVFSNKDRVDTVAVDNLDITIESGTLVGLLGPSGCGKSTTLFMLAGLHEVTSGRIFFGDEDVTDLAPEKRGIGLVFQNYALYPHMTIYDNIAFPLRNSKSFKEKYQGAERKAEIDRIVKETAKVVDIEDYLTRKPGQLSGGQQQRVAIARALAKNPKVLLLDEPLSNLDARLRIQTREEIKRIQRETGITTIFVTHDQEEAMSISDKIVVMKDGLLQQVDEPQHTYDNPSNEFVARFLGNPPINMLKAEIKNKELIINEKVAIAADLPDGTYDVGIRPEAFRVSDEGVEVSIDFSSTIGRDILVRFHLNGAYSKALVEAENNVKAGDIVKLSIKKNGVHIFDETGKRIEKW